MRSGSFPGLAVLGGLLLAGCGRGPTLYHVSGRVTYDGQPLPAGVIYFDPDVTRNHDGPQGYAVIKNGTYNTSARGGKGVVGGAYVARIEGFDGRPGRELPLGTPLFTDFQKRRELPWASSEQDFTVPRRQPPAGGAVPTP
jgi:hypothetical protein